MAPVTEPDWVIKRDGSADEVLTLMEILRAQLNKTIIMVTHDPKAAEKAHRLVHLEKGVLVD